MWFILWVSHFFFMLLKQNLLVQFIAAPTAKLFRKKSKDICVSVCVCMFIYVCLSHTKENLHPASNRLLHSFPF